MFVASTFGAGVGYFSGRLWRFDERLAEADTAALAERYVKQLFLPFGVSALDERPSVCQYADRLYMVGGHTSNLVLDEHERVSVQGIIGPTAAPTISGAAGTGTLAFLSFWDELTDEHSPLSDYLEIGDTVPRTWSNLPTHPPDDYMYPAGYLNATGGEVYASDVAGAAEPTQKVSFLRPGDKVYDGSNAVALLKYPSDSEVFSGQVYTAGVVTRPQGKPLQRASHVVLWLSVAGGLPRVVCKVRIGVGTVVESVPYTDFGEVHPGDYGRFPRCTMNTIYHDRQLMAGDPRALDTVYLSAIGFPERYEGFRFTTRNGEAVTGLIGTRDYCLVLTANATYVLQGFTEDDMTLSLVDNGIGAIGHLTNTIVHGTPYITSRSGIYMFNGAWHPVMLDSAKTLAAHLSASKTGLTAEPGATNSTRSNLSFYKGGWIVNNPTDKTIQLFLGKGVIEGGATSLLERWWFHPMSVPFDQWFGTYSWVLNYEPVQPQAGGGFGQAWVSMDALETFNQGGIGRYTASEFLVTDDGGAANLWFGDPQGGLHREEPEEVFNGSSVILTPSYFFDEAGGFEREGKTLLKFWSFADSPRSAWSVMAIGGDEWAGLAGACFGSFYTYPGGGTLPVPDPRSIGERLWPFLLTLPTPLVVGASIQYLDNVAASGDAEINTGSGSFPFHSPKSVHEHPIPDSVSGRTFSFLYLFNSPVAVFWRGVGGYYGPGPATRTLLGTVTTG